MRKMIIYFAIALGISILQTANGKTAEFPVDEWQLQLIFDPDEHYLEREANGFVFIYDGLRDDQVDYILDHFFDRIDAMMFTRIKMTDPSGDIMLDPETGDELTVDDGCD